MSRQVSVSAEVGQVVLPSEGQADNENSGKEKKRRAKAPTRKAGPAIGFFAGRPSFLQREAWSMWASLNGLRLLLGLVSGQTY